MESMKLIVSIVERGKGVSMERLYQKCQVFLHLHCAGRGTATSEIMDILGLGSSEKDVVLSFATASSTRQLIYDLDNDLRGSMDTSGIVFSLPLSGLNNLAAALVDFKVSENRKGNGVEPPMDKHGENTLILVACRRGHADEVMNTARAQGARGGTVIKGRMAGLEDLEQAYDLNLTPEREIVAIVVPKDRRGPIMSAINEFHGLRSGAEAVTSALPIDHIVRLG